MRNATGPRARRAWAVRGGDPARPLRRHDPEVAAGGDLHHPGDGVWASAIATSSIARPAALALVMPVRQVKQLMGEARSGNAEPIPLSVDDPNPKAYGVPLVDRGPTTITIETNHRLARLA